MGASGGSGKPAHTPKQKIHGSIWRIREANSHPPHTPSWKRPVKVCLILAAGRVGRTSHHIWFLGCALHEGMWSRESVRLKSSQDPPVRRMEHLLPVLSKVPRGPVALWTIAMNCRRSTGQGTRRLSADSNSALALQMGPRITHLCLSFPIYPAKSAGPASPDSRGP